MERTSRYALLVHLHDDKSADSVTTGIIKALRGLPEHMRLSLTWDRGMEMAEHARISTALHMPVFFCDPASPWQRGTNENTNGLLCQYLSKGTDLSIHSPVDLRCIQKALNNRPENPSVGEPQPRFSFSYLPPSIPCVATTARNRVPLLAYFSMIVDRHEGLPERCDCLVASHLIREAFTRQEPKPRYQPLRVEQVDSRCG